MIKVMSTIRFIDDGAGIFIGSVADFNVWSTTLASSLKDYGLTIKDEDWDVALEPGNMIFNLVHILDILFGFDEQGNLITDLYRKDTDSRGYLYYNSCHPNHVFSGIVYSQAMRLKRIINGEDNLQKHLGELKEDFLKSGYPKKLVNNILRKVTATPRTLEKKQPQPRNENVMLISTYGRDAGLCEVVKENCDSILCM